jgi:3-dehydroquinate dehydratase/shikimate dehydrogenase
MICISIAQESQLLALVDMHNAAPQCDLLEVRLDRFDRPDDIALLLARKTRPVILSCRRGEDGGDWLGREEERLAILRQCLASKADYVEIELDVADQVLPAPPAKRVISYTNLVETPADLHEIYARALSKSPDVVKLTIPARSPEEVWPVVQVLVRPTAPTVVVGVGRPGVMLALLARKTGAPWVYAALERGMESYYEQPTIRDLEQVYHYRAIDRTTHFVGVTGFGELQQVTTALLNAAFASLGLAVRCLPVEIGDARVFRNVLEAVKVDSAVIDPEHQSAIREVVDVVKPSAQAVGGVDFIGRHEGSWQGHHLLSRAAEAALVETLRAGGAGERPLQGRTVVLVGIGGLSRVLAVRVQQGGGTPILAGENTYEGQELAKATGCRFLHIEDLHSSPYDVLVRCDGTKLHPGYLRAGMTVLDLTALPRISTLLSEAAQRGVRTVPPRQVLVELTARQARAITGQDVAREVLLEALRPLVED